VLTLNKEKRDKHVACGIRTVANKNDKSVVEAKANKRTSEKLC
jgi:hypothetical protein